jgi:hypothetical protein
VNLLMTGVARGKHRARGRWGRLRLSMPPANYDDSYAAELLGHGTLMPTWGPTARCPHDDWTRAMDVIIRGGDD